MTDKTPDAKPEERYSINANIDGAFAAKIGDENPGLALEVMKKYLNINDPINALAFASAYQNGFSGSVLETRAKEIDAKKYQAALFQSNLGEIIGSRLGSGLEGKLKDEILAKDGEKSYGSSVKKAGEYSMYAKQLESDYKVKIFEAEQAGNKEEVARLKTEQKTKSDELKAKYSVEKAQRVSTVVSQAEQMEFARIAGNASLRSIYMPGYTIEDIAKAAAAEKE